MLCVVLQPRAVNVDLEMDATLQVDISDALSERDKVKFTVHTKVRRTSVYSLTLTPLQWMLGCVRMLSHALHVSTEYAPQFQTERVLCGPTTRRVHLATRLIR